MTIIRDDFEIKPVTKTIKLDPNFKGATVYQFHCYLQWRGWVEEYPWYKKIWYAWSALRWWRVYTKETP